MATTIAEYSWDEGEVFYFDRFGVDWADGASGKLTFALKLDGRPVSGYGEFTFQAGGVSALTAKKMGLRLQGPGEIVVEAVNSSLDTDYKAYARIIGWIVPDE